MANNATPAPDAQPPRPECCAACPGTRYCAPARCYCGHAECPAFESYYDVRAMPFHETKAEKKRAAQKASWDSREGETWIDSL
jgi:hypothetical protein